MTTADISKLRELQSIIENKILDFALQQFNNERKLSDLRAEYESFINKLYQENKAKVEE